LDHIFKQSIVTLIVLQTYKFVTVIAITVTEETLILCSYITGFF